MEMTMAEFTKFNESIFYDSTIKEDTFIPLADPHTEHITAAELTTIITHHFKADKSAGLSQMPLHLLKHMGPAGIECLTNCLTAARLTNSLPHFGEHPK
jgi:hypothetical protein